MTTRHPEPARAAVATRPGNPAGGAGGRFFIPAAGTSLLLLGLVAALAASVLIGSQLVAPTDLFRNGTIGQDILLARLPRTALGVLVGAALGLVGGCLQGLTRNPLADPGLLGINAGASFAMVVAIAYLGIGSLHVYIWFAFLGGAVAALLVQGLASLGRGGATPGKLVLVGSALSAALASWTSGVLLVDHRTLDVFRSWEVGTIGGRGWSVVLTGLPFLVLGAVIVLVAAPALDTLALGDDVARSLGRRVARDRLVIGVGAILLAGTATALAGPVGFVGLIAPHLVRAGGSSAYSRVLPLSAGYGAVLVLGSDVIGRVILPPTEVQVGIMTAVVGVPGFCWFLRRGRLGPV